jgi:CRISPR-associated protein Csx14
VDDLSTLSAVRDAPATALITMGGQAQVVTFALDALLRRGADVGAVVVLHMDPDNARVRRALAQLSAEFAGDRYPGGEARGRSITLYRHPVTAGGQPLAAITTAQEAEAAWAMGRDLLVGLKGEARRLHLCIAGGPRLLALTLATAAALYCDHEDRLWHLYTPRDLIARARDGAILHVPPEAGVALLPVPLVPWGAYLPGLRDLARPAPGVRPAPGDVVACRAAWARLTPRQREVVEALAGGALPQEAADALAITLKTLDSHKTEILAECRAAWGLDDDAHLTYHFVREKFGPWLESL